MKNLPLKNEKNILIFILEYDSISKWSSRSDGMADVTDSKSVGGNTVGVQVPSAALKKIEKEHCSFSIFFYRDFSIFSKTSISSGLSFLYIFILYSLTISSFVFLSLELAAVFSQ